MCVCEREGIEGGRKMGEGKGEKEGESMCERERRRERRGERGGERERTLISDDTIHPLNLFLAKTSIGTVKPSNSAMNSLSPQTQS